MKITGRKIAKLAADAAEEKKAVNVVILNLRSLNFFAEYFVIAGGESDVQVRAIADNIDRILGKNGIRVHHVEGDKKSRWILLDCGDVVIHVFHQEERRFYSLERLWGDARQVNFGEKAKERR